MITAPAILPGLDPRRPKVVRPDRNRPRHGRRTVTDILGEQMPTDRDANDDADDVWHEGRP